MTIKQQGGIFGRNPTFNDLTVEGTLTSEGNQDVTGTLSVGNQTFTGSTHAITSDYTISLSDADGGGIDIKKDAGEGSYPLYVTMQDLSNYTSGNAANYVQALQFYADAQNKYSGSGAELQILGEMRMEYDNTTLAFGSDQGAGKLMLRARQNSSDHTINNLKNHLIIHGFGGDVELGVGNLKVQSGKGIDFSATSGTGTSELFDDYEEGTWTPTVAGDATGAITGDSIGTYTKIGRFVHIQFQMTVTGNFTSNLIGGLPYQPYVQSTISSLYGSATVQTQSGSVYAVVQDTSTNILFYSNLSGTTHAPNTTSTYYRVALSYITS